MTAPRFLIFPGPVVSRTDGQRHFISALELVRLYGVDPHECLTYPEDPAEAQRFKRDRDISSLIPLFPRHDGDYSDVHAEPSFGHAKETP